MATVAPANATNKNVTWSSNNTGVATVDENGTVTGVAAGSAVITATTVDGGFTASCQVTVTASTRPAGALPGEFTVDASGTKVYFSQGNLRYTTTTGKWSFFDNQYECGPSSYAAGHDTEISLFTFGYNAEKSIIPDGNASDNVSRTSGNLSQEEDWGCTIGDGKTWRTLSRDEWTYLFDTRTVNGGQGKSKSYSLRITYGGIMGTVLYPDDYAGSVLSGTVDSLPEGVVFLPAAGYRDGSRVKDFGDEGRYWSSTAYLISDVAYYAYSSSTNAYPGYGGSRYWGFSVRLITECQ